MSASHSPAKIIAVAVALLPFLRPGLEDGNLSAVDAFILASIVATTFWLGSAQVSIRFPMFAGASVYIAAGALAAGVGHHPVAGLIAVLQDLVLLAWALAIANGCRTPDAIRMVMGTWAWTSIAWAGVLVLAAFSGLSGLAGQEIAGGRAALTFVSPNQAGNYFAISLLVLLASPVPRSRVVRLVGLALLSLALLLAASNASLGGLAAGFALAAILRVGRRYGLAEALLVGTATIAVGVMLLVAIVNLGVIDAAHRSSNVYIRNTIGRSERSAEDRLLRFDQLESLYEEGGLFGYGAAATKPVLASHGVSSAKSAHNDYIATLVERGVLGAIGLALIIGSLFALAAAIAMRPLAIRFQSGVRAPEFLVGALIVIALAGLSHEVLHFRHVWALFGIVAAVSLWGTDRTSPQPGETG